MTSYNIFNNGLEDSYDYEAVIARNNYLIGARIVLIASFLVSFLLSKKIKKLIW